VFDPVKSGQITRGFFMLLREQIVICGALVLAAGLLAPMPVVADTIAVIGTGDVAGALGPEFAAQGHTIVYGSREPSREEVRALVVRTGNAASATTPAESVAGADIVVMAVPGTAVESVTNGLGDLSGKIIIDPTNAIDRKDDGYLELVYDTSTAEIIQGAAPGAHVVKAFNTLNWRTMRLAFHWSAITLRPRQGLRNWLKAWDLKPLILDRCVTPVMLRACCWSGSITAMAAALGLRLITIFASNNKDGPLQFETRGKHGT
jgi:hypothetical protein